MKGFFGPTGVDESARGKGIGHALLLKTLLDMRDQGYGYAIIGGAGPVDFYQRSVGATRSRALHRHLSRHATHRLAIRHVGLTTNPTPGW